MDTVRRFLQSDVPEVARLFQHVFRKQPNSSPASLQEVLRDIYFGGPWFDEALSSIVFESDSRIVGFVGAFPFPFRVKGTRIMTVMAGNLMVDPDYRNPMAAARMLKQLFQGPQDATLTDTATDHARKLWEALGSTTIQAYSLQWVRALKPTHFATSMAARVSVAFVPIRAISWPLCAATDLVLRHIRGSPFHVPPSGLNEGELSGETLLEGIRTHSSNRALAPDYDARSLKWLLTKASEKQEYGHLRSVALYNSEHSLVGWYMYYPNPGNAGQVLQCVAKPQAASRVLRHLFRDATDNGSLGLIGRFDPQMVTELSQLNCVFVNRGSYVQAHSRKKELVQALLEGDAFFTRLEGEWWTRLQGDRFA